MNIKDLIAFINGSNNEKLEIANKIHMLDLMTEKEFDETYYGEHTFQIINSDSEINIFYDFLATINNYIQNITQAEIERMKEYPGHYEEHTVKVNGKEIKVRTGNFNKSAPLYNKDEKAIYLDVLLLKANTLPSFLKVFLHEVGHALDITLTDEIYNKIRDPYSDVDKQLKNFFSRYEAASRGIFNPSFNSSYDKELKFILRKSRIEFNATCSALANHIKAVYLNSTEKQQKAIKDELTDWLRKKCKPELTPNVISNWKDNIEEWYQKPSLFAAFVDGMYNFVFKQL